jgi:hypothetical protein
MSARDKCIAMIGDDSVGLLLGDSHGQMDYPVLNDAAKRMDITLVTITPSACPPLFDTRYLAATGRELSSSRRCASHRDKGLSELQEGSIQPKFAIVHARWVPMTPWTGRAAGNNSVKVVVSDDKITMPASEDERATIFVAEMKKTIEILKGLGVERILVVGPVPEFYRSAPDCVLRSDHLKVDRDVRCSMLRSAVDERRMDAVKWLEAATLGEEGVRLIDPIGTFCDPQYCLAYDGDTILYRDEHHLTTPAVRKVVADNQAAFDWVFGRAEVIEP